MSDFKVSQSDVDGGRDGAELLQQFTGETEQSFKVQRQRIATRLLASLVEHTTCQFVFVCACVCVSNGSRSLAAAEGPPASCELDLTNLGEQTRCGQQNADGRRLSAPSTGTPADPNTTTQEPVE